jgi:antitoxin component YwqK of YwqJK toxin-antitoxin module
MAAFLILFALLLLSCEKNHIEIVEVYENNAPKEAYEVSPSGEKEAWFSWYRNGIKAEEIPFKNGVPHGTYRKWSITGFIIESGPYKDSLREGKWTVYSSERVPYLQGLYKKGLRQGKWTVFNESGKIAGEQFFTNDSATGLWKKFHNELLIEENSCHPANETGYFRSYSDDGKILIYQECRYGKLNGVFMSYYPGGSLHKVGHFESGLKNGLWTEYFANGKLRKIERWTYFMRNGKWIKFNESGQAIAMAEFIDGTGVFEDTSWQNSEIHGEIRKSLGEGKYVRIETYENGEKLSTADYPKDSSKPVVLGYWKKGKKDGAWRTWRMSGILKDSLNFKDGEPYGEQFYYDSTGRLYKKEKALGGRHKLVEMF